MDRIKIFLASSSELAEDRRDFEIAIGRKNDQLFEKGLFIKIIMWEKFIDAMSRDGLQQEYNKAIRDCDLFVTLFFTKVGAFTAEEFETAFGQFQKTNKPQVYTYFKDAEVKMGSLNRENMLSLWVFQDRLRDLKHYVSVYNNIDDLNYKFSQQLDKLEAEGRFRSSANRDRSMSYEKAPSKSDQTKSFEQQELRRWRERIMKKSNEEIEKTEIEKPK